MLTMFFQEAKLTDAEIDFAMKLTPKTVDQQFMYREFCKFLDKRFIRTFSRGGTSQASASV